MSRKSRDWLIGAGLLAVSVVLFFVYAGDLAVTDNPDASGQWRFTFWFVQAWFQ